MKIPVSQLTWGAAMLAALLLGSSMLSAAPKKPATIKDLDNQPVDVNLDPP
jgi:hypothetical protein